MKRIVFISAIICAVYMAVQYYFRGYFAGGAEILLFPLLLILGLVLKEDVEDGR